MKLTPRAPLMNCVRSWAKDKRMISNTSPVDLSQPQPRMPTRMPPTPAQAATGSQVTKKKGTSWGQRAGSLRGVSSLLGKTVTSQRMKGKDPLALLRQKMTADKERLEKIEKAVKEEMEDASDSDMEMFIGEEIASDAEKKPEEKSSKAEEPKKGKKD